METLGIVSCAACWGVSAYVAVGGGVARHADGWVTRSVYLRVRRACALVGTTPAVAMLLRLASWQNMADSLARALGRRGLYAGREESCALVVLVAMTVSMLVGLSARSALGIVVCLLGAVVGVEIWHSSRVRARERALIDEMPQVFRTLAMALGSGETLTQAIEYVGVHERGYAGEAFVHVALRLRCGASTEDAMAQLSRELDAPGVGLLVTALAIAQRTGSPLRSLFQSSARLVERQGEYERLLAVKTAQVRLSVRIVCLLPLVLVCLLSLISVDYQNGLSTPAGVMSLLVAAGMDGCALIVIRRLMKGVI